MVTHADPENSNKLESPNLLGQFTRLSKDMVVYGLGGGVIQVIGLINVSIMTRWFSPQEYGNLDIIYQTAGILTVILGMNIVAGLSRFYYEISNEKISERHHLVSTSVWTLVGISLPILILFCLLADQYALWQFQSTQHTLALQLSACAIPIQLLFLMLITVQRLEHNPGKFSFLFIGTAMLNFALALLFVIGFKQGLIGIFFAEICAFGVGLILAAFFARRLIGFAFSRVWLRKILAYSLPMVPANLLIWWLASANRFFLNAYVGPTEVGYYAVASKIAKAMLLLEQTFIMAWEPYMLKSLNDFDATKKFQITFKYYTLGGLAAASFLSLYSTEIFMLMAPVTYITGALLVSFLTIKYFLNGFRYIIGGGIIKSKETVYFTVALAGGAIITLISNLLFTEKFGIFGAATSEMLGFSFSAIIIGVISYRFWPIQWNYKVLGSAVIVFVILSLISALMGTHFAVGVRIIIKTIFYFAFLSFFLLFLSSRERKTLFVYLPVQLWKSTKSLAFWQISKGN